MSINCDSCPKPVTPLIDGGKVVIAECRNLACPKSSLAQKNGSVFPCIRCPKCGCSEFLRRKKFSSRHLECKNCAEDVDVPECYMPAPDVNANAEAEKVATE